MALLGTYAPKSASTNQAASTEGCCEDDEEMTLDVEHPPVQTKPHSGPENAEGSGIGEGCSELVCLTVRQWGIEIVSGRGYQPPL